MSDETDDRVLQFPGRPGGVEPDLVSALEALLFAAGAPARTQELADVLEVEKDQVRLGLAVLQERFGEERGIRLVKVAKGWQMRTSARFSTQVGRLLGAKPKRLTRPQLEVLAVVAWQQPCTRGDVDSMRGVDSGPIVRKLLDRGLLRVAGRRDVPGRPLEYRTTGAFLELFELPSLSALPRPDERVAPGEDEE